MRRRALLALAVFLTPLQALADPVLSVHPQTAVYDAPFDVTLTGAAPDTTVLIRARQIDENGKVWISSGEYRSDASGVVRTDRMPAFDGSYTGVSPHGLLCGALPEGVDSFASYRQSFIENPRIARTPPRSIDPVSFTLEALVDGKVVARTTAARGDAINVVEEEVATDTGLRGAYFRPVEGKRSREPILLLNGSGGGVRRYAAARFASRGHPTFAFAIYNYADLPKVLKNFPIERIADGARWLAKRTGTQQVAVMGVSRGSEAAAHAAIAFPDLFSAVILSVPSHLQDAGALDPAAKPGDGAWTLAGEPFPVTDLGFRPDDPRVLEQARNPPGYNASGMVLSMWGSEAFEEQYGTRFEAIEAPVLVLAGAEDGIWPSWISAERIRQRMDRAGKGDAVTVKVYPGAGHSMVAVGMGGPLSTFAYNPFLDGFMDFGGTPTGNCEAGFAGSRAVTEFLSATSD